MLGKGLERDKARLEPAMLYGWCNCQRSYLLRCVRSVRAIVYEMFFAHINVSFCFIYTF